MNQNVTNKTWDVVVIGGGPAGMMAAGRAAELGKSVLLVEKNATLGKKLLITGGGRCNVTNAESDLRVLLAKFKDAEKFLFSPFSQWDNQSTLKFFNSRGMPTKIENEGRVFPASNTAQSVWDVMVAYLRDGGVTVISDAPVTGFDVTDGNISGVVLESGEIIRAQSYIVATGGMSRPETGSTGDGFTWLATIGHTIIKPSTSLVPVAIFDTWVKQISGVSLDRVKITTIADNKKQGSRVGKILFTHFGISGPTVLNMSRDIGELLNYGPLDISLDLFPGVDLGTLNKNLTTLLHEQSNKLIKNALSDFIPSALVPIILERTRIDESTPCHSITRESRITIIDTTKDLRMRAQGLLGTDKAIITSGGVPLSEIDTRTMKSTLHDNLYIIGDMLDIDRPSGGYGLQLCWTTGFVAGTNTGTQPSP